MADERGKGLSQGRRFVHERLRSELSSHVMSDQIVNVGSETITTRDIGLVWKVLCVIGLLLSAIGGPALTYYLASNSESSDVKTQNALQTEKIAQLEKKVDRLERELGFLVRGLGMNRPFPGIQPK